ncbi:hypothetical protein JHK87_050505 [Glycine soja]|nr:hypothetical protein JHK87_050505 [Glycine soja]
MARHRDFIRDIDNTKDTLKLAVRIIDLWVGVSLPIGVLTQSSSQKGCSLSQSSGSSQYLEKEKFFYKAEVKSLFEINDITMGGDKSVNVFPDPLDNLMGCTLAFKIKVQPKYRNSSVKKISDDPELMQPIMDLLPDVEQSLSATSDHNPKVTMAATLTKKVVDEVPNHDSQAEMPVTPAKRGSTEVFPDDNLSKKFLYAQLSTTKKYFKNE